MKRLVATLLLCMSPFLAFSDDIRGPLVGSLSVEPAGAPLSVIFGLEDIVLVETAGDARFFDGIELQFVVPDVAVEFPGAFVLTILKTGTVSERSGVTEVNGEQLLSYPLVREGRVAFQILLRSDATPQAGATTNVIDEPVASDELPLAVTLESRMKGIPPSAATLELSLELRPLARRIGGLELRFILDDGSLYQAESFLSPDFELLIDDRAVPVSTEFLLEPGLHEIKIVSDIYQDQQLTFGVEQATMSVAEIPLLPALATVSYTAPRDSRVYLDGRLLDAATGDFTALPGEHTIVVVVGDYTLTRRFSVEEGREYNLSVTMDVAIEEVN